ncbi:MAG: bifunctional diaminohydroxyphosphoribosylaminopyrimidine deaminase/5-amino-6-(5-phosphoribosylamino)uracil reductase RibD [Chloroflexi bacterium]|nr:bifunctional diaminohydroxyphosphoribosylaminopyrimidine deaminase/5-amino-6-(5-phosphoribosylamino)uracil reductase RibD [Chloroflexota bacterium]
MPESMLRLFERALALARLALGRTSPNPAVGAVVVCDDEVIGEGFTQPPGGPHAEVVALRQAGERARGATLYVTLEPCGHFGRTPPCSDAIVAAGIRRVHYAVADPNPLTAGKGPAALRAAGVEVSVANWEPAHELNEAFLEYVRSHRPFVTAKYAMTLDGKIATPTGDSRWVSDSVSRALVHELRDTTDAVLVGIGTVLADDPQLTARPDQPTGRTPRQPLRVVVDSGARLPLGAKLLSAPGRTLVATTAAATPTCRRALERAGAEILVVPDFEGRVDLDHLLAELGRRDVLSVLVESGGELLAGLLDRRLVDKVLAFVAPKIAGGAGAPTPVGGLGVSLMADAYPLRIARVERTGEDVLIVAYLREGVRLGGGARRRMTVDPSSADVRPPPAEA